MKNIFQLGLVDKPIKVESHEERRRKDSSFKKFLSPDKELIKTSKNKSKKISYGKYILSNKWRKRRNDYFKRFGRKCTICGEKRNVHIHHISYENLGGERDGDLVVLCELHHDRFHEKYGVDRNMKGRTYNFIQDEQEIEELRLIIKNL